MLYEKKLREEGNGKVRYNAFGVRFNKAWIYQQSGRPVIYEEKDLMKELLPEDEYWRIVNYDLNDTPKKRIDESELTQDEKNMRWDLNKFFYTTAKQSLTTAYTMMLKEKYCDSLDVLMDIYPSFYQFRYFYRKTKKMQNFYISKDGLKSYQRNNRSLTGDGVQEFAPVVGVGMLDSTICNIYLVNDAGNLVGRPILTAGIDAYSGLCCGYALSWEGGVYSLRGLMLNIIADKSAWCKKFGMESRDAKYITCISFEKF